MSFIKHFDGTIKHGVSKTALKRKLRQANASGQSISDDYVLKNGFLYTVVRAISARVNQNYDSWPSNELRTAAHTFVGKPVFVNHQNSDPKKARGRVVAARYIENGNDKYIEAIMEVDAARFPLLAHEIRTGGLDSVSMGAEAGHTICSMCGNSATDTHDMCDHVKFHKGEHLMKNGHPQLVFESCHKLGFFELSYVFDPADETAVVSKVIQANRAVPNKHRESRRNVLHHVASTATSATAPSVAEAIRQEWGSVDNWLQWAKERAMPADPRRATDNELTQKAEHLRDSDERAFTNHAAVMAAIKRSYGEVEAPSSVDTLRQEEPGSEEDFHSYVETPKELSDPNLDRTQQLDREQESEGLDNDRVVEDIEGWEAPDHARNEQQQKPLRPMGAFAPVNDRSSPMNEGRAREDSTMGRSRSTLASRGKDAKSGHQRHRKVAEGPLTDGGDQSVNAQSTREPGEEEFLTPTPPEEAVETADGGTISNTENNLVARINATQQQLLRDAARYQAMQAQKKASPEGTPAPATNGVTVTASRQQRIAHKIAWMEQRLGRKLTADESATVATSVPETADVVNPALSGTDDQSLKGSDFQPADPNAGVQQTQPADSRQSNKVWAAFDGWLTQATGKTARQHGNQEFVLRQAKRFASHYGFNPQAYFPTLGNQLRQIQKDEVTRRANMQRHADTSLEVAAPGGRIDVEAPTSNTTDAEAQASQFDVGDFGRNAGDGIADPDLSTDYVTWAPGESKKEGFKRASTASAVRCADLWVEAGLKAPAERYNLIASHEVMQAGTVADRIAMLELFKQARTEDARRFQSAQRRVASGISRGATPAGIPAGLTGATRTAGVRRTSALEDQSTDGLMFL